jgi:hypothetical protein
MRAARKMDATVACGQQAIGWRFITMKLHEAPATIALAAAHW